MTDDWDGTERRATGNGRYRSTLEQHIITGLAAVLTLLCSWIGLQVVELGRGQVKTDTRVEQLQKDNGQFQESLIRLSSDRASLSELRRVEERVDRLERDSDERPRRQR